MYLKEFSTFFCVKKYDPTTNRELIYNKTKMKKRRKLHRLKQVFIQWAATISALKTSISGSGESCTGLEGF